VLKNIGFAKNFEVAPEAGIPHGSKSVNRTVLSFVSDGSQRRGLAGCLHDLGDLFMGKFTPGEQAGAMPPGFSYCPAQKHFGARAVQVGLVGERVCAR
jgi:hypothetical protein